MQKRILKPANNLQKLYRYLFSATATWYLLALIPLPWDYHHFGFWGWVLIYSSGLALADVVTGAITDIYQGTMRKMRAAESSLDETQSA